MKQPRSTVKHDVGTYILSRCMRQFHETAGSPANTSFPPLVSLFLIFDHTLRESQLRNGKFTMM